MTFIATLSMAIMPTAAHAETEEIPRVISTSPAVSSSTTPPDATGSTDLQAEIDNIPLPSLREKAQQRMNELVEDNVQIGGIEYAPYVADESSGVSVRALPSDCGLVVIAYMNGNGSEIVNEALTDCENSTWTRHTL